jgi:NADH-quinone oxidoreductase subunit J
MTAFDFTFYAFAILTLLSASVMVFSKNLIHCAVGLLFAFFGVAGIYVLLAADFLAAVQVLIYVGGILVLLLFGVMLSQRVAGVQMDTGTLQLIPALLACGAVFAILTHLALKTKWAESPLAEAARRELAEPAPTSRTIGNLLMTEYLLPFEIISILLLAALVGAAFIARREAR